jgi:nicotinamidase/pyrazinamidase
MRKVALIVVDVQRDFCEGGALAAAGTLSLLAPLVSRIEEARRRGVKIVFTQDWHPVAHSSFKKNGGPWPVHCVAESAGAELMPPLTARAEDLVVHKGVTPDGQGYSGFDATGLAVLLRNAEIDRVAVTGIATEYCVRATAMDAAKEGFSTVVLSDLIRPVQESAAQAAIEEMRGTGVQQRHSSAWLGTCGEKKTG